MRTTRTSCTATTSCAAGSCARLCTADGVAAAYRAHHRMLRHRARLVLGDADLAEDAVQEAFLRAWRACARFDATRPERLGGWLTSIVRNVAIDMARARAVRGGPPPLLDDHGTTGPAAADHADTLVERAVLREALAGISVEQRTAVLATVVHGHQYRSVAAALDVPEGTVKTRVFHGLRRMRAQLAG